MCLSTLDDDLQLQADRAFQWDLDFLLVSMSRQGVSDFSSMSGVPGGSNITKVLSSTDLDEMVSEKIQKAFDNSSADLLGRLDKHIGERMTPQAVELRRLRQDLDKPYKFRRKGNEEQYDVNRKALSKLDDATESLAFLTDKPLGSLFTEADVGSVGAINSSIYEGKDILQHRQKLIKLADKSEVGWKLVDEYESHELADDSDDEKRILKAENRAARKIRDISSRSRRGFGYTYRGAYRGRATWTPYSRSREYRAQPPAETVTAGSGASHNYTRTSNGRPGLCFTCGRAGHWRQDCPDLKNGETSKGEKLSMPMVLNPYYKLITGSCLISPVGRLRSRYSEWEKITENNYILDIILNGYKIPFITTPESVILDNNLSARNDQSFVEKEIQSLLRKGSISVCDSIPKVVNPLTVAYGRSNKPRLVLDCRSLNSHFFKYKFRMEDANCARQMFKKGEFFCTFDLRSAYHHIDIFDSHRTYLGFSQNTSSGRKYFVYNVLPFGISTAGYVFSKTLRELTKNWRSQGHKVILYLDDGIIAAKKRR